MRLTILKLVSVTAAALAAVILFRYLNDLPAVPESMLSYEACQLAGSNQSSICLSIDPGRISLAALLGMY